MAGKKRTEVEHVWLRNEIFQRFLMFSFHWDIVRETEGFCTNRFGMVILKIWQKIDKS